MTPEYAQISTTFATRPQVVRFERVTVNAGGQAIVGTVGTGGPGDAKKVTLTPWTR